MSAIHFQMGSHLLTFFIDSTLVKQLHFKRTFNPFTRLLFLFQRTMLLLPLK